MVLAGQRGQRIWFIPLFIALVLQTYGSIVVFLIPAARQTLFGGPFTLDVYRLGQTIIYPIAPVIAPLVALIYSLRLSRSARLPARTEAPDEDSEPVELEYSRLGDAPTG